MNHKNGNGGSQKFFSNCQLRPHIAGYLENGDFFLRIGLPYTCNRRFQVNGGFQIRFSGWRVLETEIHCICVDGRKRRFPNTMTSCLSSGLALLHIQLEDATNGRRSVLNTKKKYPLFSKNNTRLRVDGQIGFKTATCGDFFLKNGGKNLRFRKYPPAMKFHFCFFLLDHT